MFKRYKEAMGRIWTLRSDPADQLIVSGVYFVIAAFTYIRPDSRIFARLLLSGVTSDAVGAIFFMFAGLLFRYYAVRLVYYLFLLLPLIALISFKIWFVTITPDTSFVAVIPATAFLVVIIKNSFTIKRVRG